MHGAENGTAKATRGGRRDRSLDAALRVLARDGARGLTHRAVDREADLPEGSTSNYFRTRDALLEATLSHHLTLDLAPAAEIETPDSMTKDEAAALLTFAVEHLRRSRDLLVARYELFLESTRRPALAAEIGEARTHFAAVTERIVAAIGCREPQAHGRQLVACVDGLLLDSILGGPSALEPQEIEAALSRLLASC